MPTLEELNPKLRNCASCSTMIVTQEELERVGPLPEYVKTFGGYADGTFRPLCKRCHNRTLKGKS